MGSPADETPMPPCDVQPDELDVAITVDRLERATTLEIRHIRRRWAGLRTFAADKTPVVGMDPGTPGFFWFVGQGGFGIMVAPAMAQAAAALIATGHLPAAAAEAGLSGDALSPTRFR